MKKLIAVTAMVLSTTAVAQPDKDWWACQHVHSVGMNWENNRWVTKTFEEGPPFVLMSDGNGSLTTESVAKAILFDSSLASGYTCRSAYSDEVTCDDHRTGAGTSLLFQPKSGKGGISYLGGTTYTGSNRDTVMVSAFECTKG